MPDRNTTAWLRSIGLLIFHSINVGAAVFLAMHSKENSSLMNMAFLLLGISGGTTSLDGLRARLKAGDFSGSPTPIPPTRIRGREPTRKLMPESDPKKPTGGQL